MRNINLRNSENELKLDEGASLIILHPHDTFIDSPKKVSHYKKDSLIKNLFFYDIFKFVTYAKSSFQNKAKPKPLTQKAIHEYVTEFNKRLEILFELNNKKINYYQLIDLITKVFKKDFLLCVFLYIIDNSAKVIYSLLVSCLIESVSQKMLLSEDATNSFTSIKYAIFIFVIMMVHLFSGQHNWFLLCKTSNHLKLTLLSIIYNKLYRLSYTALHGANQGKLFNVISGDMNILENKVSYLLAVLLAPYAIILSSILLFIRFGTISLISIICLFVIFALQFLLAKYNVSMVKNKSQASDKRIHFTNELLEGIRPIKMYAWESAFIKKITEARNEELFWIKKMNLIISLNKIVAKITPFFLSSLIFLIHYLNDKGMVTTPLIFSTFQLFDFISIYTVLYFGLGALTIMEYKTIFERIATILSLDEDLSFNFPVCINDPIEICDHKTVISMKNYTGFWSTNPESSPNLKDINLEVKKAEKIAILGKIGSGKSSLLYSLLNELPKHNGEIAVYGSIAFIEQIPFIFSGTIRENILFGMVFNYDKYNEVLNTCALSEDFSCFSDGDLTEIGEKGVTLSGGQKIRICLARALYANADIYLLDDPFSSVDSKVARNVFEKIFKHGLLQEKTVILVTHHLEFIHQMDKLILVDDGKVILNGKPEEILLELKKMELENLNNTLETDDSSFGSVSSDKLEEKKKLNFVNYREKIMKRRNSMYVNEESEMIKVDFNAYKQYISISKGNLLWISTAVFLFILTELLKFFLMRVFGISTLAAKDAFFFFYILLVAYLLVSLIKYDVFMTPLLRSNTLLHNKTVESISKTSVNFFDTNPVGRILNRFTNDLGIIDSLLLLTMRDNLEFLMSYFILIFTVFYTCYYLVFPAIVLITIYIFLYKYFKQIITESKKLDLLSRGPIFSYFASTISGLLTIRVYEQVESFKEKYGKLIEENSNNNLQFWAITRIYSFLLEFFGIVFSFLGILGLILSSSYSHDLGLISQSMISLIFMTEIIQYTFTLLINTELMMNSAVRLFNYSQIEDENSGFKPISTQALPIIDKLGEIIFKNTFLKYGENNNIVLKNINFQIKPGEKIACVGRSGAGKSSLIQALFGMVRCEENSEIWINGRLIQEMDLKSLRKGISIIPQNPFIFSGTIQQNLDPFNEFSIEKINSALFDVNLLDYINSLPNQLDSFITNNSCVFSMGQKQMICLARAILRNSPILILDEATSSCDMKCDEFIQKKINERFKKCTVFTIAHRLLTIAEYDKVMVLKHGEIVEFDNPYKLLISSLNENDKKSEFAEMVRHTGSETAQMIFNKAKIKYKQRNSEID